MAKTRELVAEMKATGKYHEPRLDAPLFMRKYHKGELLFHVDRSVEPWRLAGVIGLWSTRDHEILEIGTFYVRKEYEDNGVGNQLFDEIMKIAPPNRTLITVMRNLRPMNIAMKRGFHLVSSATMQNVDNFCTRIGLDRRPPATAYSRIVHPTDGERWMLVRKAQGAGE